MANANKLAFSELVVSCKVLVVRKEPLSVILRSVATKDLVLNPLSKRAKDEILHSVQNDREGERLPFSNN